MEGCSEGSPSSWVYICTRKVRLRRGTEDGRELVLPHQHVLPPIDGLLDADVISSLALVLANDIPSENEHLEGH